MIIVLLVYLRPSLKLNCKTLFSNRFNTGCYKSNKNFALDTTEKLIEEYLVSDESCKNVMDTNW